MLTDNVLRSKIDSLWDKLWTGGLSNPLDAIEQLSYLLFMKRLEDADDARDRAARRRGVKYQSVFRDRQLRWSEWTQRPAENALKFVKETVFPKLKEMGGSGSSFESQMKEAEFKINKPSLLIEACKAIDEMKISQQNQDVQGDLYEYLLGKLNTAKITGQFRTPRHIIRMMVQMIAPQARERICDPAAGTAGFLVNAYQYVLEQHTSKEILEYDDDGMPHHLTGDLLSQQERKFLQTKAITGYDNDSGMTMLRIGSMNLMLHGITHPHFHYADTLSKSFNETKQYDVVFANPPFKGAIDSSDVNPTLPTKYRKTELLFLHLFLRLLEMGGRCAAISPDGVLFGSNKAHVETRKMLVEENRLDAVISMPSGVFKPYAGVSTAVLIFTKGGTTDRIWFYDMEHDGFSLDDKRQRVSENDLPDILECWKHRHDTKFTQKRAQRLAELREQIAPLKKDRLQHQATIHRLKFEEVIASDRNSNSACTARQQAEAELNELQTRIAPLQKELNQLSRQFWVGNDQVKSNKYDLSASRYREIEQNEGSYEQPSVTLERLRQLEAIATSKVALLERMLERA